MAVQRYSRSATRSQKNEASDNAPASLRRLVPPLSPKQQRLFRGPRINVVTFASAKLQLIFELTKKKCKKVYPMDCFFDSAYHLSCPCDSCDYTGTGRYSLFMMMRVPAAEEAWPMAPCMLEYVGYVSSVPNLPIKSSVPLIIDCASL